jgi:mono/diheme cytochrome c family protein
VKGWIATLILLAAVAAAGVAIIARIVPAPPAVDPLAQSTANPFRGRYVALLADCAACHTAPGGAPYAGGRALATPLGAIMSTNVTPDRDTGIGAYRFPDFLRLMRNGVTPDGRWLYPAMPFTDYARMSDADLLDLFAYLQQEVAPVRQDNRGNRIPWPLSWRAPLALWNKMFHHAAPYRDDPAQDALWNRGAYLVQGPGHCGACHTPRNWAMAERDVTGATTDFLSGTAFDGGAPINLRGNAADGLGRWSEEEVMALLATGRNRHSAVSGAMVEVVAGSTQYYEADDLRAVARYLKSLSPAAESGRARFAPSEATLARFMDGQEQSAGGRIFMDSCAACHRLNGGGASAVFAGLAGNPMVLSRDPSSLIAVILAGARLPATEKTPSPLAMPGFAWRYDDSDVAALATFIRRSWGNQGGSVSADQVAAVRRRWH